MKPSPTNIISLFVIAALLACIVGMSKTMEWRKQYREACTAKGGEYHRESYGLICTKDNKLIEMEPKNDPSR